MKVRSLKENFSWTLVGNLIYAACQYANLSIIAKFGSLDLVGLFSLGLAITAPVYMFSNLQLRTVQVTDVKDDYLFGEYFSLRLISVIISSLSLLIYIFFSDYNSYSFLVLIGITILKALEHIRDIVLGLFQKNEDMTQISKSQIIIGILTMLSVFIVMFFTHNLAAAILVMILITLFVLVFIDIRKSRKYGFSHPIFNLKSVKKLFILSIPLGLVAMLISLNVNIPRYFLEQYVGLEELGIFASISYLMVAGNMVVTALGQSATPRLAKLYSQNEIKGFVTLLGKLVIIGFVIFLVGYIVTVVAGEWILIMFFSSDFAGYSYILKLSMISAGIGFISSFIGFGTTAIKSFKIQFPIFLFIVLITTVSSYLLIPSMGLEGASFALIISALVNLLLMTTTLIVQIKKQNQEQKKAEGEIKVVKF